MEAWGYSVSRFLENLPDWLKPDKSLINKAKELDSYYIPSRYTNFHEEGVPMDYYSEIGSHRAVEIAREIISFCRDKGVQA